MDTNENSYEEIVMGLIDVLNEYKLGNIVSEIEERIRSGFKENEQMAMLSSTRLSYYLRYTIDILENESGHLPKEVIIPTLNKFLNSDIKIESLIVDLSPEEKLLYNRDNFDLSNLHDYRELIAELNKLYKDLFLL